MEFSRQEYWSGLPFLTDMREASYKDSEKYFQAQGTMMLPKGTREHPGCHSDQAPATLPMQGDARENAQRVTDLSKYGDGGYRWEDSRADRFVNEWGQSGEDPDHCRPAGLPLASTELPVTLCRIGL
ncbi:serum amyloid A-2 protein-like [Moschus berezovskii]|uniref:serum amyloid A-2 protein-like n=1 Tax=Moschus berezovskii TaxID=68408 RepID=UPI002444B471|nr:serum amyloid A-2 protein-like [Moschus berezovskii]